MRVNDDKQEFVKLCDMKRVIRDDYVFDIDIEKAKSFYSDLPRVFNGLSEYLPELTRFMASLGIDIEKPVKYNPDDTYDLLYRTCGTFTTKTGYELDFFGEDKYVSVVPFENETKHKRSGSKDIINIAVFGIMLRSE